MAVWQKVITSGSNAVLNQLNVGTTQVITNNGVGTNLSGSFTGSFAGSLTNNLTQGTGITAFTYNGGSATTVAVSGASSLSTNAVTKWTGAAFANSSLTDNGTTITGTTSIQLTGASSNLSGSFSGSFKGDGSNLTGVTATFPVTQLTPLTTTAQVFINDGANKYATVAQFQSASWAGVSGDILINGTTGVATIQADSVALGTDTSGSYVKSITAGVNGGITALTAAGEGIDQTISISGSATLSNNNVMKWSTAGAFVNSNITDTGTQVQIGSGATGGVTIAAGGIAVTGDSSFANNLTVTGNLTVAGTASFTNTDNLTIRDKFILINSGSTTLADSGWVTQYNAAGSGSAFYLEAASAGTYGRYAVAYDIIGTSTSLTVDEYVNTTKIGATTAVPTAAPTWGGATNGIGNTYVTSDGQIFIYA